jgi:8-oxo-dGTP pyrophosphatase MutT (NUDIX family)
VGEGLAGWDAAAFRLRLSGPDPADPAMPVDESELADSPALIPAAVLVGIVTGPAPGILLTKRTPHLRQHSGQVSFPGGRIDPGDADAEAAAVREAQEEVGLDPGHVEVLGRLRDYVTGTGYRVTPVLALIAPGFAPDPSADEVDAVFQLPLAVLLDPAAPRRQRAMFQQNWREYWVWPHPEHYIWGATAGILVHLARRLKGDV